MKRVLTFGVFDYFHYGHLKLFERCKNYGDFLIVAVQQGNQIHINKPLAKVMYSTEQRVEMVGAVKYVDEVIVYNQVCDDIKNIDFDVLIVGGDQNSDGFARAIKWCETNKKEIIHLDRTPNICSTDIKEQTKK